jgi:hypothetical protein
MISSLNKLTLMLLQKNLPEFEFEDLDRNLLLTEACNKVLALQGHYSDGWDSNPTDESRFLTDLMNDQAALSSQPILHKIIDQDYLKKDYKVPVPILQRLEKADFYWLEIPYLLAAERDWAYNRIRIAIEMNPGFPPNQRPKAFSIFPENKFQELFKLNASVEVGVDAGLNFAIKTPEIKVKKGAAELSGKAKASVKADAKTDIVFGPFNFNVKKAKIHHTNTGNEAVRWDLDDTELVSENDTRIISVIEVPRAVTNLKINAKLAAYRNHMYGNASVAQLISQLGKKIAAWWKGGLPKFDSKTYDINLSGN